MPVLGKFECETNRVNFLIGEVGALLIDLSLLIQIEKGNQYAAEMRQY
jgi:hypothetical protein